MPVAENISSGSGSEKGSSFLGVEKSLLGKRWVVRPADDRTALALAQRAGVPELVGRVLASRGIGLDEAEAFLNPTLRDMLPDPSDFLDMDLSCTRLADAVMAAEKVCVFGDYDVDGATSAALLSRYFAAVGRELTVYVPDRLSEGYGPNAPALLRLRAEGASLAVTVDCGTSAHQALEAAAEAGLDVIVVDHHKAETLLPRARAVINPNRLDETSPHGQLCAVGVTFLLVVGINRALRERGWFKDRPEPDLTQWLDLVALGTVCDVVPLTGVNRALVTQGLKVMARRGNAGLRALADVAGIAQAPGAYHAGFVLGPRINAGGRVGRSDLGARLLSTDDGSEADGLAHQLDGLNQERQVIEAAVLKEAMAQVESRGGAGGSAALIFAAGEGWHPGVIGIVASRLKERYNRPACVVALDGEKGLGSGRSVSGLDLGAAVIAARQAGHLEKGGGHAMAAGFQVAKARLADLEAFLAERLGDGEPRDLAPSLYVDGGLKAGAANVALIESLERVGPFGSGNPEPRFAITAATLVKADPVGRDQNHLRCILADDGGRRLTAIAFRAMDRDLGPALVRHGGAPFHFAGKLRLNEWQGRTSAQFHIEDAAPVW